MKTPAAWEREHRLRDGAACIFYRFKRLIKVIYRDDREGCMSRFCGIRLQSEIDVARRGAGVGRAEVGECQSKRIAVEATGRGQIGGGKLDEVDARHR